MHETLNYFKDKFSILWQVGWRTSFPSGPGSIIWADKGEILEDGYPGINQIIGHTPSYSIEKIDRNGDELYFINLNERTRIVGSLILTF